MVLKRWALNWTRSPLFGPVAALIGIMLLNFFVIDGFFKIEINNGHLYGSLIDVLNRAAPLVILGIGMTLVIAKEGIDISVGSVLAISGALAIYLLDGLPVWVAVLSALAIGALCGLWNGVLVSLLGIQPMVATLILMTVGRGIAQLITNGKILTTSNSTYEFIGKGYLLGLPFSVFIAAAVFFIAYMVKKRTALGLFLEATGANRSASEYAGIQPRRIFILVYTICGFCAAIGGLIITANISSADANNAGLWYELDAILAVVIGGTSMRGGRFYLGGTVIGAIFIQSLTTTIYSMGIKPEIILLVKALVVIIVCLLQSPQFREMFVSGRREVAK